MTDTPAAVSAEAPAPDLVETLLAEGRHFRGEPDCVGPAVTLLVERAAAEISRLTAEVERLRTNAVKMLDEVDREYNRKTNAMIERHAATVARLKADNERLTAALETVRDEYGWIFPTDTNQMIAAALKEPRT